LLSKTERLVLDAPAQIKLGLPETPQAEAARQTVTYERRTPARRSGRVPAEVFAHLPVQETVELIPAEVQAEPEAFERISEEKP
jgi:hypothetical protein